jgi:restriction system protein
MLRRSTRTLGEQLPVGSRFARYLNPVLAAVRTLGGSARPREVYDYVARTLGISDAERSIPNQSGVSRFENDVAWARFYLARAGYLDASRHGVWALTDNGRAVAELTDSEIPDLIRQVQADSRSVPSPAPLPAASDSTRDAGDDEAESEPPDLPKGTYREEALEILRAVSPAGFERFCQRLLREAGFQQVRVTGRSGDGGIDGIGILQVNPFVSFKVLFQSKRYAGSVTPAQVRDFRGAMMGRADKGLILTTGTFTADAQAEAVRDGVPPIELVDGHGLVTLLEQLELGLRPKQTFEVDRAFFEDFL